MTKDTTSDLIPEAIYTNNASSQEKVIFEPGPGPHKTNGSTTGPSDYVLNAGMVDKDVASEALNTNLGSLRAQLTTLQDKINIFLTERMKDSNLQDVDMEKLIGDGGDVEEE